MKIPAIKGIIKRRILLNYRVAPEVVQKVLPGPFRPKLVNGYAIVGICLIRLESIRPKGFPALAGVSSENTAHRFAVEWDDPTNGTREGVFIPRRDTDSVLNSLAGGRIFPGVHHHAIFNISDQEGKIAIEVITHDKPLVDLQVTETNDFPSGSVFPSLHESSQFFEAGCIGYSSRPNSPTLDGLKLQVPSWKVSPLNIDHVRSSYFDDTSIFPPECIELDHALLMRNIPHEWNSIPKISHS